MAFAPMPVEVDNAVSMPGAALEPATLELMESRFNRDFSSVRIYSGDAAAQSAAAVGAHAYTVGERIIFGATAPSMSTKAGQRLLAHELTHVVQQTSGGLGQSDAALEREADRSEQAFDSNVALEVSGRTSPHMQRKETGGLGDDLKEQAISMALQAVGLGPTSQRLVRSGLSGAVEGFSDQWNKKDGTAELLGKELKKFSTTDLPALVGGYLTGLVRGVVSPITDLFQILVLGEQARDFADKIAQSALSNGGALAAELNEIGAAVSQLVAPLSSVWATMRANKLETLRMLIGFADTQGTMVRQMEEVAASLGRAGGTSIAKALEAPWKKEEPKPEQKFNPFKQPAQYINQKGEQLVDAVLSGPWGKVGDTAGYAIGFAVVQVALLVFSEGIGNLITEIGKGLGTLAKAGTLLGRSLEGLGKFVEAAGATIKFVEGAINGVMGVLAKPFLPILKPVLEPFGKAMEKLAGVLRRLLGMAEKDTAHLAVTAVAKTESGLSSHAHTPAAGPKPVGNLSGGKASAMTGGAAPRHIDTPHVDAPPLAARPHAPTQTPRPTAKPDVPNVPSTDHHVPHNPTGAGAGTHALPPQQAITFVEEHPGSIKGESGHRSAPAGNGHEIVETPDSLAPAGIGCELHSPPPHLKIPCPAGMGATAPVAARSSGSAHGAGSIQIHDPHDMSQHIPKFDPRVAGTQGIRSISIGKPLEGKYSVTIEGSLQDGLYRQGGATPPGKVRAPEYNKSYVSNKAAGLSSEWENAHLWGPGFGDEAGAGMMKAPKSINQWYQNEGIEGWLRDMRKGAPAGARIDVQATAVARDMSTSAWQPKVPVDFLDHVEYRITVHAPAEPPLTIRVDLQAPMPPSGTGKVVPHIDPPGAANPGELFVSPNPRKGGGIPEVGTPGKPLTQAQKDMELKALIDQQAADAEDTARHSMRRKVRE
ncbi:MAG: DUF4157 domain-containing protein [Leptothrix sp. (in: b-proteobacteria)]